MKTETIQSVQTKFEQLHPFLSERTRRLWAATEAKQLGWGGVCLVEQATGISHKTIRKGIAELDDPTLNSLEVNRSRNSGAGRKKCTTNNPQLLEQLEALIEPVRGDPESPLRWTCKSLRRLATELTDQGHPIGVTAVRLLLHELQYSLQGNAKTREGADHPDRNEQFLYISDNVKRFLHADQPVISVDTKKKENLGNYSNKGREYRPKKSPLETNMHDFPNKELGKAIPYGVYDIGRNEGWVNIGVNHDTAQFAANSIRRWWQLMGQERFPKATRLLITADSGGSNGYRTKLWKLELQTLANDLGLNITTCHFPPGTSKWNKIEHRLFSFITQNWRGQPLYDLATVVNLISHTSTSQGLRVRCAVDDTEYEKGIKLTDADLVDVQLKPHPWHGEWNYTVNKRTFR
jgi:Rhodopirellula transposase.